MALRLYTLRLGTHTTSSVPVNSRMLINGLLLSRVSRSKSYCMIVCIDQCLPSCQLVCAWLSPDSISRFENTTINVKVCKINMTDNR